MTVTDLPWDFSAYFEQQEDVDLPDALAPLHDVLYSVNSLTISGVYFLLHEGEVVYIGQSTNVAQRVAAGHPEKEFDSSFCILVPQEHLLAVEAAFIQALNPKYNLTDLPKGSVKLAQTLKILDQYGWEVGEL